MSSPINGGETAPAVAIETDSFQVGPLVESMQVGLNIILGIERRVAILEAGRPALIEGVVDLDEAEWALSEAAHILSPEGPEEGDKPRALSEFLHMVARSTEQDGDMYAPALLKKVGLLGVLVGAEDKLKERAQESWVSGSVAKAWLGRAVVLRRPPVSMIREDDNWPNVGPLYRGLERGEPVSRYYRGGDLANQQGRLEEVSLEENGRMVISRGDTTTELIELFEAVKDPETGMVTHYLPRVSVERLSRAARVKGSVRRAAIKRLGPELS